MSRRKRTGGQVVSLFPFLSILACIIGVLTLILAAMALGELDPESIEDARGQIYAKIEHARMFEDIRDGIAATEDEVERTRRNIAEAKRLNEQLEEARAELRQLEAEQVRLSAADQSAVQILSQAHDLRRSISELRTENDFLNQEVERLRSRLGERTSPRPEPVVRIVGGGSGTDMVPTFIECSAVEVVVYHNRDRRTRIRRGELSRSDTFAKILDAIRLTPDGIAVFLIREDGLRTYFVARSIARMRVCPNGKVPVLGHGRLDLSAFDELMNRQALIEGVDVKPDDQPTDDPQPAPAETGG